MARQRKRKINKRGRRIAILCLLALVAALALLAGVAALNANTLHVMRAEVCVENLPPSFEGVTLLYLSDVDLCGINTAKKSATAIHRLQSLRPDMLVLGGDYASAHLFELLNRADTGQAGQAQAQAASDFFHYISDFDAPLGRYAVMTSEDASLEGLSQTIVESGFTLLNDGCAPVIRGSENILLMNGLAPNPLRDGGRIVREDCVISVVNSPESFPMLMTAEADGGGHVVDLALAGHTHGGQIRLFERNVLALTAREQQYLHGWSRETGVPMLTTSGLGCEGANLRVGSQAEAWLITLISPLPESSEQNP